MDYTQIPEMEIDPYRDQIVSIQNQRLKMEGDPIGKKTIAIYDAVQSIYTWQKLDPSADSYLDQILLLIEGINRKRQPIIELEKKYNQEKMKLESKLK